MFERLRKVDVRAILKALDPGQVVTFQLVPREHIAGRWQGGTYLEVKRLYGPRRYPYTPSFRIGALAPKNTEDTVAFVNSALDGHHAPRV